MERNQVVLKVNQMRMGEKQEWVNIYFKMKFSYVKQSFNDQSGLYKACNIG